MISVSQSILIFLLSKSFIILILLSYENSYSEIFENFTLYFSVVDYCKLMPLHELRLSESPRQFTSEPFKILKEITNLITNSKIDGDDSIKGLIQIQISHDLSLCFTYIISFSLEHKKPIIKIHSSNESNINPLLVEKLSKWFTTIIENIIIDSKIFY